MAGSGLGHGGWNVAPCMPGRKQQQRNDRHAPHPVLDQSLKSLGNRRPGQFQEAALNRPIRRAFESLDQPKELVLPGSLARAVTDD